MSTLIEQMADFTVGLSWRDVPERVLRKARWQQLSALGAVHASARHQLGQHALRAVERLAGEGTASLLPSGRKVDVMSAVYAASALSLALDYDDYLLFGHSGHSAVCVSLLVGQHVGASLRDVLLAQIAANEIAGRIGAAVVLGPHNGQAWSFIHLAAAAASTARLLGLSARQTAHAVAIAMYQPNYVLWPGFMGPESKVTTAATPAVAGVRAAFLAAQGATGALDILECRGGFLDRFSYCPLPRFLTGYGRAWTTDTLAFKPVPGCAYVDATVDAMLDLRQTLERQAPDRLRQGVDIDVAATLLTVEMDALARAGGSFDPLAPVSINFSIAGNVAIAWHAGSIGPDQLAPAWLRQHADALLPTASSVRLRHDPAMTTRLLVAIEEAICLRAALGGIPARKLSRALLRMLRARPQKHGTGRAPAREWVEALRLVAASLPRRQPAIPFDLGDYDLSALRMPFSARVVVRWRDGSSHTREQVIPRGAPGRPDRETQQLVIDKCLRECTPLLGAAGAASVVDTASDPRASAADLLRAACAG